MFRFIKTQRGFTLVELIIVVVFLGLFTAIAVPATSSLIKNSKIKECKSNQLLLKQKVYDYMSGNYLEVKNSSYWKAGSYDPQTDTWVGTYTHWGNEGFIYYYFIRGMEIKQKVDCTPGEHFLRYAFSISPDKEAVFPTSGDGCKQYVVYHDTRAPSYINKPALTEEDMEALRNNELYVPSGYLEIKCTDNSHMPADGWIQVVNV